MPPAGGVKSCRSGKQIRYFEAACDVLSRQLLKEGEEFDHNRAHELLAALKTRKAQAHCKLRCETKSLKLKRLSRFGTQPNRKIYPYRDIVRHYAFSLDSSVLILGCNDEEHQCRYYEFLKLQPQHVNEICDLLTRARCHPDFLLTDETNYPNQYSTSHSNLTASTELPQRSGDENKEMKESHEPDLGHPIVSQQACVTHSANSDASEDLVNHIDGSPDLEIIEPVVVASQNQSIGVPLAVSNIEEDHNRNSVINPTLYAEDPLYKKLCSNIEADNLWAIDLKYIESHPDHGNRISNTGGVYLFIAHHRIPEPVGNSIHNHEDDDDQLMTADFDPVELNGKSFSVKNTAEPEITMAYF